MLNVVLNLFFVVLVGRSVDGVAIATVISNAVSALILFSVCFAPTNGSGCNRQNFGFPGSVWDRFCGSAFLPGSRVPYSIWQTS